MCVTQGRWLLRKEALVLFHPTNTNWAPLTAGGWTDSLSTFLPSGSCCSFSRSRHHHQTLSSPNFRVMILSWFPSCLIGPLRLSPLRRILNLGPLLCLHSEDLIQLPALRLTDWLEAPKFTLPPIHRFIDVTAYSRSLLECLE